MKEQRNHSIRFDDKFIYVENGEIVWAGYSPCFSEKDYHDLKNGNPRWEVVELIVDMLFAVKVMQGDLDEMMNHLNKDSKAYAFFKKHYQQEKAEIKKRLDQIDRILI